MRHIENSLSSLKERVFILILLAVVAAGVAMRIVALGEHPYGLYQDEAVNGLDALRVWEGDTPLYFPANNGREPFFIYLMAGTIRLFGQTAMGVRAAAATAGILTIPATYFLGRTWANRRVGLLSAAILAAMLWHVHLSRVGFRAVTLPLWMTLALGMGALALQRQSRRWALAAGAAYGVAFYTYSSVRFTPLALIVMLAYGLIWQRTYVIARWRLISWMLLASLVVALPLGILAITQPELVFGRSGQVAIWNESVHQGRFAAKLLESTLASLGMFVWRGDDIWRHNVPNRPVFDMLMGAVFVVGVGMAVTRWRRQPLLALALIWTLCLLLPTLLAEDAPHFLRASGVLPMIALIPAVALDEAVKPRDDDRRALPVLAAAGFVVISCLITAVDYFGCRSATIPTPGPEYEGCYRDNPVRGYFFQAEATQLATGVHAAEGRVYLDRRFWDTFPSVRFLVGDDQDVVLFDEGEELPVGQVPLSVFVWPHVDYQGALNVIPAGVDITVDAGPMTRGDLEPETYRLYVAFDADAAETGSDPVARFANGLTLTDLRVEESGESIDITLAWMHEDSSANQPRLFVHALGGDGQTILAQVDEPPGTVYYPPLSWSVGSVIIQRVLLPGPWPTDPPQTLRLGLYDPTSGDRYGISSDSMPIDNDAIVLPLAEDLDERQ